MIALVMDSRGNWRRRVVDATGLPFSRIRALRRLADGPRTLSGLAESMTTDAPATTVIVNNLEGRGLVLRTPHPDDKRAKVVSLTAEGKRVLRSAKAVTEGAPPSFDALDAKDVADLLRLMHRLRSA